MPVNVATPYQERPWPTAMEVAPDATTARAGRDLAARPFRAGRFGPVLWAEFPDGHRAPAATVVTDDLSGSCNCAAVRFPCRHVLALLEHVPTATAEVQTPAWVHDRAAGVIQPSLFLPSPQSYLTDGERLALVRAGLSELERWLSDLLGQGLARLPTDRAAWHAAAARLVDAYMPDLAAAVRELALLPGSAPDWPERLLPHLGRLQLLVEAFRRYETLPAPQQGDLRRAVGWPDRPEQGQPMRDRWQIIGNHQWTVQKQVRRRVLLQGLESGRMGLIEETLADKSQSGRLLPVGWAFDAEVLFEPSAAPLVATWGRNWQRPTPITGESPGEMSLIEEAVRAAAAGHALNPWRTVWPMVLNGVRLEHSSGWRLRDRVGTLLPLNERFGLGWTLLATVADGPLTLFGEWDGERLRPLSVANQGHWASLEAWRGIA